MHLFTLCSNTVVSGSLQWPRCSNPERLVPLEVGALHWYPCAKTLPRRAAQLATLSTISPSRKVRTWGIQPCILHQTYPAKKIQGCLWQKPTNSANTFLCVFSTPNFGEAHCFFVISLHVLCLQKTKVRCCFPVISLEGCARVCFPAKIVCCSAWHRYCKMISPLSTTTHWCGIYFNQIVSYNFEPLEGSL